MDDNTFISQLFTKVIEGGGHVALGFGMWFGWKVLNVVKKINDTFEKLVDDVQHIKESHTTLEQQLKGLREDLREEGYNVRTGIHRRIT